MNETAKNIQRVKEINSSINFDNETDYWESYIKYIHYLTSEEFEPIKERKNKSGIYMIYIDEVINYDFYNNKIIPVYIGKSRNKKGMSSRWTSHRTEIRKFISDADEHGIEKTLLSGRWDGKHLYSKIGKILIKNNLSVDNVKFRVIEFCESIEESKLLKIEQKYIKSINSIRFGLNQFEFIVDFHKLQSMIKQKSNILSIDKIKLQDNQILDLIKQMSNDLLKIKEFISENIAEWIFNGYGISNFINLLDFSLFFTKYYYSGKDKESLISFFELFLNKIKKT
ncbi:hypothetical protein [Mesoplasma photuris]|uniref:hypothetical protein n=1 Tax=Mesoplasma photuris TaxID=217731 RepID=UPI0004E1B466|nr:hypothetical protein [Mesoplasma photuris]